MMNRWKFLVGLTLGIAALALDACRHDSPPPIEICILDGFGGGDCTEPDHTQLYKSPSAMKNYWATNPPDEASYTAWCYNTTTARVAPRMEQIKEEIHANSDAELRLPTASE